MPGNGEMLQTGPLLTLMMAVPGSRDQHLASCCNGSQLRPDNPWMGLIRSKTGSELRNT
jgi:hypothetical protein